MLSEATRSSVGVSLFSKCYYLYSVSLSAILIDTFLFAADKIVVFDEAHNIMETVASLNTVSLSYMQLCTVRTQI